MSYLRLLNRNHLHGDYAYLNPDRDKLLRGLIAGDMRRMEQDQLDLRHLDRYAQAAGITLEQVRAVLDLLFTTDCEGQTSEAGRYE